mgnify:CR=1 FL=1
MSNQSSRYRQLTDDEWRKTYGVSFTLEELFEPRRGVRIEERLVPLILTARWRIAGVFKSEREYRKRTKCSNPRCDHSSPEICKKRYSTDNYISRPSGDLGSLLHYIQSCIHRPFVNARDLAARFQDISPADQRAICKIAEEKLLAAALLQMHAPLGNDLWYDQGSRVWQLTQSCVDEARLARKQMRSTLNAVKGFYDKRTYHGRNGNQARQRDKRNGNAYRSTGYSSQVR